MVRLSKAQHICAYQSVDERLRRSALVATRTDSLASGRGSAKTWLSLFTPNKTTDIACKKARRLFYIDIFLCRCLEALEKAVLETLRLQLRI